MAGGKTGIAHAPVAGLCGFDGQIADCDEGVAQRARMAEPTRRLMQVEGAGPLTAIVATADDSLAAGRGWH